MRYILIICLWITGLGAFAQPGYFNYAIDHNQQGELFGDLVAWDTNFLAIGLTAPNSQGYELLLQAGTQSGILSPMQVITDTNYLNLGHDGLYVGDSLFYLSLMSIAQHESTIRFGLMQYHISKGVQFRQYYGDSSSTSIPYHLLQEEDGSILQIGSVEYPNNDADIMLVKYNSTGQVQWDKRYGNSSDVQAGLDLVKTSDNGYLLGGYRDYGSGARDILLVKVDSVGDFEWEKTYGGSYNDFGGFITKSLEGGYMIGGGFIISPSLSTNPKAAGWLIKIDEQGAIQWQKKYYLPDSLNFGLFWTGLAQLPDSSYVAIGSTNAPLNEQGWIVKTDRHGNELWNRTYTRDSTTHHYFYGFDTTTDGGFVVCGSTKLQGGTQDAWLIKLDSFGCNIPGCQIDTTIGIPAIPDPGQALGKPYPNPFTHSVTIPYKLAGNEGILEITDLLGKTIWQQTVASGSSEVTVPGSELPRGVWLVVLREDGRVVGTRKIIAQ